MLDVGSVCAPCCMLLRVVVSSYIKQSLKLVKLLRQRLTTFLWFLDRQSVAQQCWMRCTDLRTFLGPGTHITHGLESLMGCILPTMRCRFPTLLGVPFKRYNIMTLSILLGLKVCVGPNNMQYNECWRYSCSRLPLSGDMKVRMRLFPVIPERSLLYLSGPMKENFHLSTCCYKYLLPYLKL